MNRDTDLRLRQRDRALDSLAEAARELADANDRASRVYHGLTANEAGALSILRVRLAEFDESEAQLLAAKDAA